MAHHQDHCFHDVCAICQDCLMTAGNNEIGATYCGHVFHQACYRQWDRVSRASVPTSCPICTNPVSNFIRLFISSSSSSTTDHHHQSTQTNQQEEHYYDSANNTERLYSLRYELRAAQLQTLRLKNQTFQMGKELLQSKIQMDTFRRNLDSMERQYEDMRLSCRSEIMTRSKLQREVHALKQKLAEKDRNQDLHVKFERFSTVAKVYVAAKGTKTPRSVSSFKF